MPVVARRSASLPSRPPVRQCRPSCSSATCSQGGAGVAFGAAAGGGGEQLAEVAVALAGFDQEQQPLPFEGPQGGLAAGALARRREREPVLGQHDLGADQRADAGGPGRLEETRRAVDAGTVGQGDRRQAELGGAGHQVFRQAGAVEEGKGGGHVQLGVARPGGPARRRGVLPPPQLLLAGAVREVGAARRR